MQRKWRISSFNGALLACYFVPAWTIVAYRIMVSPMQGLYERPNVAMALYFSDHLQLATMSTIRFAWLLALGKLTVAAFFAVFLLFSARSSVRRAGSCDEALVLAVGIGAVISFISMLMAARVGGTAALHLHVTELLLLLGAAVLMALEPPLLRDDALAAGARSTPSGSSSVYAFSRPSS
jgi:hypothetical protein